MVCCYFCYYVTVLLLLYVALSETLGPNSANVISSKMTSTSRHEKLAINC